MRILLDTNVIAELISRDPNESVLRWMRFLDPQNTYLSVITIAELKFGIERLKSSERKQRLMVWLRDEIVASYDENILPVTVEVAEQFALMRAKLEREGKTLPITDAFIAATAALDGLTIATRNTKDFEHAGVSLINPWL